MAVLRLFQSCLEAMASKGWSCDHLKDSQVLPLIFDADDC
jgi:hypothetical protein